MSNDAYYEYMAAEDKTEIARLRRVNAGLVEALEIAKEHMDQSHVPAMMCVNAALRSAAEKDEPT